MSDAEYLAVLRILRPHMSVRNLTEVVVLLTGRDSARVYNDVLGIDGLEMEARVIDAVQTSLTRAGFDQWLRDA